MKKNFSHIVLAVLLSFAVTDYIWIDYLQDDHSHFQLDFDKDGEEKVEEGEKSETGEEKLHLFFPAGIATSDELHLTRNSGFYKVGNSFISATHRLNPQRYILYQQLKLDC